MDHSCNVCFAFVLPVRKVFDLLGTDEGEPNDSLYDVGLDQESFNFAQWVLKCFSFDHMTSVWPKDLSVNLFL